jgi:hypothetical protein
MQRGGDGWVTERDGNGVGIYQVMLPGRAARHRHVGARSTPSCPRRRFDDSDVRRFSSRRFVRAASRATRVRIILVVAHWRQGEELFESSSVGLDEEPWRDFEERVEVGYREGRLLRLVLVLGGSAEWDSEVVVGEDNGGGGGRSEEGCRLRRRERRGGTDPSSSVAANERDHACDHIAQVGLLECISGVLTERCRDLPRRPGLPTQQLSHPLLH